MPATATVTGPTTIGSITETVIDIDVTDYIVDSQSNGPQVTPSTYPAPTGYGGLAANAFGPGQRLDKMNRNVWGLSTAPGVLRRPILTNRALDYHVCTWANVTSASYYYPNTYATWDVIIVRAKALQIGLVEDILHAIEDMYIEVPQNAKDALATWGVPNWAIPDYFAPQRGYISLGSVYMSNDSSSYGGRCLKVMTEVPSWDPTERRIGLDSSDQIYGTNSHIMRFNDGKCVVKKAGYSWYKGWTDWADGATMVKDMFFHFASDDDIIPTCFNTTMTVQVFSNPSGASATISVIEYDYQFNILRTSTYTPVVTYSGTPGYYFISPQDFTFTVGTDCRYIRITSSDSYVFFFIKELPIAYIRNGQPTLTRGKLAATPLINLPYCSEARNGDLILGHIPRA